MKTHSAKLSLLPPLRLVEVSIIARFLNSQEKLKTIAYLSKEWNALVQKPYAWHCFPD